MWVLPFTVDAFLQYNNDYTHSYTLNLRKKTQHSNHHKFKRPSSVRDPFSFDIRFIFYNTTSTYGFPCFDIYFLRVF